MTRDAIMISFGIIVAAIGFVGSGAVLRTSTPARGLIVCHGDGTSFTAHIDTQGISQADLTNAVALMCKVKEGMGI